MLFIYAVQSHTFALGMLVHGTCNPVGESDAYSGVYLRADEIARIVKGNELVGKPVLLEHDGDSVGKVVSAWEYDGQLDVLVDIPTDEVWGSIASACVAANCLRDFSLGYKVQMSGARGAGMTVGEKQIVEVSLVKKGAREHCHIKNFHR